jgi:hypothetical protein
MDDKIFRSFDTLVHPNGRAVVTLVGRYFAGERQENKRGDYFFGNYGHMGMYSLLVIQQVLCTRPEIGNEHAPKCR